jgi:hypothetical protein
MLKEILVLIHFFGFGSLFAGLIKERGSEPKLVNGYMLGGALTQLISGFILASLNEPEVNHTKIAVKLGVLVLILVGVFKYRLSRIPAKVFNGLLLLTVFNVAIAVLWK